MKRNILSKEELVELLNKFVSVGKVASHLSIPYSTIYAWYKKYDIELLPSCMTVYEELRSVGISELHRSVILGSILGDGGLIKQKRSKNARLQIGHCTKQLEYLKWKKQLLDPFVKSQPVEAEKPGQKTICGKSSFSTGYWIINTIAHPDITIYYNKYYYMGEKRVIEEVVNNLDLLSLAIWLADDGSFTFRKDCKYSLRGSIATCSFTCDEINILIRALKRFYNGTASLDKYNNTIALNGTAGINELLDKVTKILPKCIHYKFAPQRLTCEAP